MERLQFLLALGRNDAGAFLQNQGLTSEIENKCLVTHLESGKEVEL
jgi:hypothetical protein